MDLNYVLLWMVGASASLVLAIQLLRFRGKNKGWVGVSLVTLLVLGLGLAYEPGYAGYAAGGLWALFFLVPAWGSRLLQGLVWRRRYRWGERVARLIAALHPFDGWLKQPRLLKVLRLVQRGEWAGAWAYVEELQGRGEPVGPLQLELLKAERRWPELARLQQEAGVAFSASLQAQILGETGRREELLRLYELAAPSTWVKPQRALLQLIVLAHWGEMELLELLLRGPLSSIDDEQAALWRGLALQSRGCEEEASRLLRPLLLSADATLRRAAQHRLEHPVTPLVGAQERARLSEGVLAQLRAEVEALDAPARGRLILTWVLIGVNVLMFLPQLSTGLRELDPWTLGGVLVLPPALTPGQWWRMASAGFLHLGAVHLGVNILGLAYLGRYLERRHGWVELLICYLGATFGANGLAVLIVPATQAQPVVILGASGGVMGLLGASLALTGGAWLRRRVPALRRQVLAFGAILGLQLVFDLSTPEVSSTVHLAGLGLGMLLGSLMALWGNRRMVSRAG